MAFHDEPYSPNAYGAHVRSGTFNLAGGTGYTIAFSARADKYRNIFVAVGSEPSVRIPVGPTWRRYVIGFQQSKTQSTSLRFLLGKENSEVWLDSVYLFPGNANVFRRDFEHGVVLANATPETKTIASAQGCAGSGNTGPGREQRASRDVRYPCALRRNSAGSAGAAGDDDRGTDPTGTDPGTGSW